jgi:8-oxo-dGTP pyrophosphatase MutT (NUDIX family)
MAQRNGDRRQVAALAYHRLESGAPEVMLVTSRETKRFVIPKGWPMKKRTDAEAAAIEAYEEAGVIGKPRKQPIGAYRYFKRTVRAFELIDVEVFAVEVKKQLDEWPEMAERIRKWLSPADASLLVDEPGLAEVICAFKP